MTTIPHFEYDHGQSTLMVNDKAYIALAAECHNSSASSQTYMQAVVWPKVHELNLNTLLVPVYWEMIEPKPDQFDFASVKALIMSARRQQVKLVLLWFGLWKNGRSTYMPEWLKTDPTIQYACRRDGRHLYSVSPADSKAVDLDAKAFGKLMAYLKQVDGDESTVIMVQVENEVGLLTSDFDYSIDETTALNSNLPKALGQHAAETWVSRFGERAGEHYLAFLYASAIQTIANAGKQQYALPMYVNAWLEKPLGRPGTYPTGGPTARMLPIWQQIATAVDLIAPDLYVPNFKQICDAFSTPQSALIIPETRQDLCTVSNLIYGISHYNLNLFSPFGAEDFFGEAMNLDAKLLKAVTIDADAFDWRQTGPALARAYSLLSGLIALLVQKRQTPQMHAFMISQPADRGRRIELANCAVIVHFAKTEDKASPAAGFILELGSGEFLLFGVNIRIELVALEPAANVGLLKLEEGKFEAGQWQPERVLNGDERVNIEIGSMPRLLKLKTHLY